MVYDDGSYSIDVVFTGFLLGPGGVASGRWTFVGEDDVWKVDGFQEVTIPEGILPGAVLIEVQLVDYAFAISQSTIPANTPVIFRTTNASAGGEGHVNAVVTYAEGTTAQQLITGEVDPMEGGTGFFDNLFHWR